MNTKLLESVQNEQMEDPTVGGVFEVDGDEPIPGIFKREHWVLIGALLSPLCASIAQLVTNPLFGVSLFGFGRGYSDMRTPIIHHAVQALFNGILVTGFFILVASGNLRRIRKGRGGMMAWLRNSPGSRRLTGVMGVVVALVVVKWFSTELPGVAYPSTPRFSMQSVQQWAHSIVNAVRWVWPFAIFLFIYSHASKENYKQRESRNVRPGLDGLVLGNATGTESFDEIKSYWPTRALWAGAGWLAMAVILGGGSAVFAKMLQGVVYAGSLPNHVRFAISTTQYLSYSLLFTGLPIGLIAWVLLYSPFKPLVLWLERQAVFVVWILAALCILLEVLHWRAIFSQSALQMWSDTQLLFLVFEMGFRSFVNVSLALLLALYNTRRAKPSAMPDQPMLA